MLGALAESLPPFLVRSWGRWCGRDPDLLRPFFGVEKERARGRRVRDELVTDIGYYARRVGLDAEKYTVRTEDGFLLELHHIFDPNDPPYYPDTQKLKDEEEDEDEDE